MSRARLLAPLVAAMLLAPAAAQEKNPQEKKAQEKEIEKKEAQEKKIQDKKVQDNKAQDKSKVYRGVSADKLEGLLKQLNIDFEKAQGKAKGAWSYDFERNNFKVRLHNYDGRDLWLDVVFTDQIPLKEVNAWNVRAKFSRAVQLKTGDKTTTSLESQLDCEGGVTDGMIRQFILRFDNEVKTFVQFLTK
jgi:hypothetical protein